jgi:hypothetical protein
MKQARGLQLRFLLKLHWLVVKKEGHLTTRRHFSVSLGFGFFAFFFAWAVRTIWGLLVVGAHHWL